MLLFSFSPPAPPPAALSPSLTCAPSLPRSPKSSASPSPPPKQSLCSPDLSPFVDASSGHGLQSCRKALSLPSLSSRPERPVSSSARKREHRPRSGGIVAGLKHGHGRWKHLATPTPVSCAQRLPRLLSRSVQVHRSSSGSRKRSHKDR